MSAEAQQNPKKTFMSKLVDLISSIFLPVLSVIMAAGVLKAFLLLLSALHLLSETSDTYYILSFISNAGFYFLPLLLAHSTAKHFGGDAYLHRTQRHPVRQRLGRDAALRNRTAAPRRRRHFG